MNGIVDFVRRFTKIYYRGELVFMAALSLLTALLYATGWKVFAGFLTAPILGFIVFTIDCMAANRKREGSCEYSPPILRGMVVTLVGAVYIPTLIAMSQDHERQRDTDLQSNTEIVSEPQDTQHALDER